PRASRQHPESRLHGGGRLRRGRGKNRRRRDNVLLPILVRRFRGALILQPQFLRSDDPSVETAFADVVPSLPRFQPTDLKCCAAAPGSDQRAVSPIRIPYRGRSVIVGHGSTRCPGASVSRNRWAMVARISTASISAKDCPIHPRGPPPNGK